MSNHLKNVATVGLRWRLVDAKGEVLGRLASQVSMILMGKDKPTYTPHWDEGDVVVVKNARHVELTGKKVKEKVYKWYTGYVGGLKERTVEEQFEREPIEVLRKAVERMLPKNRLRDDRMRKLRIFPDEEHAYEGLELWKFEMPPRNKRELRPREARLLRKQQAEGEQKSQTVAPEEPT
eukprot:TRINITY_DN2591_c0_g2_i1.p1 TRINITY_DN2591_c0_g2~~TRINITY_DN2591_c0_g2_i1.p1  ORF type:complete len:179 (+),score=50.25 TRINITY_DN2591_c0_g2_i1:196-732(+)